MMEQHHLDVNVIHLLEQQDMRFQIIVDSLMNVKMKFYKEDKK
jgi:hypothetical protein